MHHLASISGCGAVAHLHLAVGLQQLRDGHLVLLQSPLHQLRAANVDCTLHVRSVVLRKRPAVNHQQAARPSLDEARQALDIHDAPLVRALLPCHDEAEWKAVCVGWGLEEEGKVEEGMGRRGQWRDATTGAGAKRPMVPKKRGDEHKKKNSKFRLSHQHNQSRDSEGHMIIKATGHFSRFNDLFWCFCIIFC